MEMNDKLKELMITAVIERELELTRVFSSSIPPDMITATALITLGIHLMEHRGISRKTIEDALITLAAQYHTNGESK